MLCNSTRCSFFGQLVDECCHAADEGAEGAGLPGVFVPSAIMSASGVEVKAEPPENPDGPDGVPVVKEEPADVQPDKLVKDRTLSKRTVALHTGEALRLPGSYQRAWRHEGVTNPAYLRVLSPAAGYVGTGYKGRRVPVASSGITAREQQAGRAGVSTLQGSAPLSSMLMCQSLALDTLTCRTIHNHGSSHHS